MSSALVRQALELVDQADSGEAKRGKRGGRRTRLRHTGQDHRYLYKPKSKKRQETIKTKEQLAEENIKKLLKLSTPAADTAVADKIVERAIKRKPLADKIEIKPDDHRSILFPEDESFEDFEKELFCS